MTLIEAPIVVVGNCHLQMCKKKKRKKKECFIHFIEKGIFFFFFRLYGPSHRYICVTLCVLGLFANLVHIWVLTRPSMQNSSVHTVLIAIAMADIGTMASYFVSLYCKSVKTLILFFFSYLDKQQCSRKENKKSNALYSN